MTVSWLALLVLPVAVFGYVRYGRPWQLTWGATPDEAVRTFPGDELVERPTFNATRAITIAAAAEDIWPWLVQVGVRRAGWYSYDFLDNFMRPSADRIIPEFQTLAPGDVIGMSPDGKHGMKVHSLNPPHTMIWATLPDNTWVWVLNALPDGSTRLLTRVRARYRWLSPSIAFSMLVEFADIWMMRKMLLNLRDRAERTAKARTPVGRECLSGRATPTATSAPGPSARADDGAARPQDPLRSTG